MTTNPETGGAGKRKKINAVHPSDRPTRGKKCLLHGPGNSTEECKVLMDYSTKYAVQRPHREEARSSGNKKRGKTVLFDGTIEEVNRRGPPQDVPYNLILWYVSKIVYLL